MDFIPGGRYTNLSCVKLQTYLTTINLAWKKEKKDQRGKKIVMQTLSNMTRVQFVNIATNPNSRMGPGYNTHKLELPELTKSKKSP